MKAKASEDQKDNIGRKHATVEQHVGTDDLISAPRLRTAKKRTDFPIVARSLSRPDESGSSTVPIHIPRHSLDDDEASM